jgi:type IV secretory pathway VirB2 component (pilin)
VEYGTANSLTDPLGSSPLVAAVSWLEHTLLGTIATTVAVIAVAWVGVMMLSGRVNLRHGVTVILGCFLLFGASSIAAGIQATTMSAGGPINDSVQVSLAPAPPVALPPAPDPNYDPYAGASVPRRR